MYTERSTLESIGISQRKVLIGRLYAWFIMRGVIMITIMIKIQGKGNAL